MTFRKAAVSVSVCVCSALLMFAQPAHASSVLDVDGTSSPVADVAISGAMNGSSIGFATNYGTSASCTSAAFGGYIKRGATVTSGSKLGAITSFATGGSSSSCLMDGWNYPAVIEKGAASGDPAEWGIYATATPAAGATTVPVEIRDMTLKVHSTTTTGHWDCDFEMAGAVPATFNQVTQRISISTGMSYPLLITAFDGTGTDTEGTGITYAGQVYSGDQSSMTGSFTLDTPGAGGTHF